MTYAERLYSWNRRYDELPQEWRFQVVFWFIIAVAALNMALTIADGFPFGLLVLLAVIWLASVRVPFAIGWLRPPHDAAGVHHASGVAKFEITPPGWVYRTNHWYDRLPEMDQSLYVLGALALVGTVNMALTIAHAFPFGLLFLLAVLAMLAIRGPYVAGWFVPQPGTQPTLALPAQQKRLEHAAVAANPIQPLAPAADTVQSSEAS